MGAGGWSVTQAGKIIWATAILALAGIGACRVAQAQGYKPSISVSSFTNHTSAAWWGGTVAQDLAAMLTNELMSTGDFTLVERAEICSILGEQALASAGMTRPGTGPAVGNITGARYTITGVVSAYNEGVEDTGGGLSFGGFHVGGKKQEAYVAIDLRVLDTETGEVAYSRTIEGRSSSHGLNLRGMLRGGLGGDFATHKNTPAGKAVRAALIEATNYLDCVMVKQNSCRAAYERKEQHRRNSNSDLLDLSG